MKAINLLPRDAQRSFGVVRGASAATVVLLGALATALVLVLTYVLLANNVNSKRDQLAQVNQRVAATQRQVADLKPYADLEQLRQSLLERVRTVAGSRFDWPGTLDRIARAFPSDAALTSFTGSPTEGSGQGPSVALGGCTPSHDAAAKLIDRLRAVKGVTGVALQSSSVQTSDASSGAAAGDCPYDEHFTLTIQLKGPAGAAPAATAVPGQPAPAASTGASSTPATSTPASPAPATTGGTP